MTLIEESPVAVSEVAKRLNMTVDEVEAEAAALGLFVGQDWKLQPALSIRDAFALVSGSARQDHEHQAAFQAWQNALQAWQTERESVRRQAFDVEWKARVRDGWNSGSAADKGHEAAREAVAQFDKANPEPQFSEPEGSGLRALISRVKAGTR